MKASRTFLFIFPIMISLCLVNTQQTQSQSPGTIYIRSDGSVKGTDKIQRDGNVYSFNDNINGSIVVEKNSVVIDGAGYTLQGNGSGRGIDLHDRSNVTVKNMQIRYFLFGMHLSDSLDNTIYANYVANNTEAISLSGGLNNTIIGNTITNNNNNGIEFLFASSRNIISGNNITNNWVGIQLYLSCRNNTFSENNIILNKGIGIWLHSSYNNTIIRNNITNNYEGIKISDGSNNNIFFHNNFINNTQHADVSPDYFNHWSDVDEGNYWDDYNGLDNNGNGIGDNPYIINENNQDNYPLMEPFIIPEFPSCTPMLLVLTVLAIVVAIYKRRLLKTPIH